MQQAIAAALVAHPRGVLALDGDPGPEPGFPQVAATTPELCEYVNGVVLPATALRRRGGDGRTFPRLLHDLGVLPGVRADTGATALPGSPGEVVTGGTDGLTERMAGFARAGIRFATWRSRTAVAPSVWAVRSNANALARFARAAQDAGIVPVLHCGPTPDGEHTADRAAAALALILTRLFAELDDAGADLRAIVLSPGAAVPGSRSGQPFDPAGCARLTGDVLRLVVPASVAGIAVHTGSGTRDDAVALLTALADPGAPWPVSFCLGRSLTAPAEHAWRGRAWLAHRGQLELVRGLQRACAALVPHRPERPRLRIA